MATYVQQDRPLQVTTALGPDKVLVRALLGAEALSQPYRFTIDLLSDDPSLDGAALLRTPATITVALPDGKVRLIHGRFNRFVQLGRHEDMVFYQAELVPRLWFASLVRDCRIYQNKTPLEIVEEVLKRDGIEYENRCTGPHPQREYCVQYRESDLDFVSRLLEEEGVFYFFEHAEGRELMVLADANSALPVCPEQPNARMAVEAQQDEGVVLSLYREQAVHTSKVTLKSYDYLQPPMSLNPSVDSVVSGFGEEFYDYTGDYTSDEEGYRRARLRIESEEAQEQVVRGTGDCRAFLPGTHFKLQEHFNPQMNVEYVLTAVKHRAESGGYRTGALSSFSYGNEFTAVPMSVPFRTPRTVAKPIINGTQTAVVVGPSGEEVYTDRYGRIKVQFPWDREGKRNENSSCWVRVAQPWAGKGYGTAHIPRIGSEVVVQFEEGDPDYPIVIGSVYNAEQTPPFDLPAAGIQQGLKSRSSKGGGGYNEISVVDTKGSERLLIHAQKDEHHNVLGDQEMNVDGNRKVHVKGSVDEKIDGGLNQTVTGGIKVTTPAAIQMTAVGGVKIVAPAGVQVIAPGGHTQVDDFWDQTGGRKNTAYAETTTITGWINAVFGGRFQLAGWDNQVTGLKVTSTGISMAQTTLDLNKQAFSLKNAALGLATFGFYIIS